jgi:hypothetical protein
MKYAAILLAALSFQGCAALPAVKSAYDIGVELCQLYYAKHPVAAFSVEDICKIAEVNQPFVDSGVDAADRAGAKSRSAFAHKVSAPE